MCSNYSLWAKMVRPRGSHVLHRLVLEKHEKIFYETTKLRALIFGMKHHIVDLCQVCSNYAPWTNYGSPQGSRFTSAYIGKHEKKYLFKT